MTRNFCIVLIALVLCFAVLATEGRSTQQTRAVGQKLPLVDESGDDAEEYRFLTGGGTGGGSNSVAINNLITQKQQLLENLRPTSGSGTSTGAANVIFVNAGATAAGLGGTTGIGAGAGAGAGAANQGSSVAGLLLPQVVGAAVQGGNRRRTRRPSNRRRRRNGNRNRNRNRNRSRGQSSNRQQRRPQVYLVRSPRS